jgi:hypothetical protein
MACKVNSAIKLDQVLEERGKRKLPLRVWDCTGPLVGNQWVVGTSDGVSSTISLLPTNPTLSDYVALKSTEFE